MVGIKLCKGGAATAVRLRSFFPVGPEILLCDGFPVFYPSCARIFMDETRLN